MTENLARIWLGEPYGDFLGPYGHFLGEPCGREPTRFCPLESQMIYEELREANPAVRGKPGTAKRIHEAHEAGKATYLAANPLPKRDPRGRPSARLDLLNRVTVQTMVDRGLGLPAFGAKTRAIAKVAKRLGVTPGDVKAGLKRLRKENRTRVI